MTFEEAIQNIKKWLACINRDDLNCLKVCDSCQNHVDAVTLYESLTVIVSDAKKKTDEDKQLTKWLEELIERRKQQSEIIYCKDCEYYGRKDKVRFYRGYDCLKGRIATIVPDRDFCSRAERKTNETD